MTTITNSQREYNQPASQVLLANMIAIQKLQAKRGVQKLSKDIKNTPLNGIHGIGEKTVQILLENNITTLEELKTKSQDDICDIIKNPISRKQIFEYLASNKEVVFRKVEEVEE